MSELRPRAIATPLAELCTALQLPAIDGAVTGLTVDSRATVPGDLYAALPGALTHGAAFASQAIRAGAVAIVTDVAGASMIGAIDAPVLVVDEPRARLGELASIIYRGNRPLLVGVTGTNGKTTTTHCIQSAADAAEWATAVIGTLGIKFHDLSSYSGRTTPEAPAVHAALTTLAEAGARIVAMEVSSHALSLHRVDGLHFDVSVFLGLTQDHLDFHGSMESYFAAKQSLFTDARSRRAVINIDDDWGRQLAATTAIPFVTYGLDAQADWTAENITIAPDGRSSFIAKGPNCALPVTIAMPGGFNIANALAALATLDALGVDLPTAIHGLAHVAVPGRFEYIANERGVAAYADYAHTPDAVDRVLKVARAATRGRLIAVLGCGGDRDPAKRPLMGAAAAKVADVVIVTDDNPRSEDPASIRNAILSGISNTNVTEIGDRAAAIRAAVATAKPGDCIMVLGKGHETGQEVAGVVHPFDDRVALREALGVIA